MGRHYPNGGYVKSITKTLESNGAKVMGSYGCRGYDTYGPFKLVGGIAKGHPTEEEIDGAVTFYDKITRENQIPRWGTYD